MNALKSIADLSFAKVIIIAVFVTIGYYVSYFDPGEAIEQNIQTVQTAIDAEELRKADITKVMKKEEEMRGSNLQLQRNLEVVKSKIPNAFTDSQMQLLINEAATNAGVSVQSLSASQSGNNNANAKPLELRKDQVRPENLIEEVKFTISLNGTFESFLKFLDSLAKEDKVIKIRNFSISKGSDGVDEEKIRFDGEIVGFKQANIVFTDQGGK